MGRRIPCAGAIVLDPAGRLLLVRRANDPGRGLWSIPGGKCNIDESATEACVREVSEETGLVVRVVRHVGSVERPAADGDHYAIDDFLCEVTAGDLVAGDDALEARWIARRNLARLDLVDGLIDALDAWGLLPR